MDIENVKSWASQPDVCRCCLSASGTWDMTASYISENAVKEVYFEMLRDCYGITLSYLTEWGPSRMVCKLCVGHLREACSFREQVLQAEKHFTDYWTAKDNLPITVKTEDLEIHSPLEDGLAGDGDTGGHSDDDENQPINTLTTVKSEKENKTKKKRQKSDKTRRKKKKVETCDDYDSDAPISTMLGKNALCDEVNKDENSKTEMNTNETTTVLPVKCQQQTEVKMSKQVSERKRVMMTCHSVIRETTACPFRHHKSWFQCFFCPQDFMEVNLLRQHTLLSHQDVELELKKIKRYPRSLQIEISNMECRSCHSILTDVNEMRRHLDEVHQKVISSM